MDTFVLLFVLSLTAFMVVVALYVILRAQAHGTTPAQEFEGICAYTMEQTLGKTLNKARIVTLLEERGAESNEFIRSYLGVSRQTVSRYMTELEDERKVEQLGDVGRGVVYRLK